MTAKGRVRPAGNRSGLGHDLGADDRSVAPGTDIVAILARRREASRRLEPLACGCRDPWPCRCGQRRVRPAQSRRLLVVALSTALDALRRAWLLAEHNDRAVLADIAAVLTDLAEPAEVGSDWKSAQRACTVLAQRIGKEATVA